eukprot:14963327-Heterocapsa_arctica.AAC.1
MRQYAYQRDKDVDAVCHLNQDTDMSSHNEEYLLCPTRTLKEAVLNSNHGKTCCLLHSRAIYSNGSLPTILWGA